MADAPDGWVSKRLAVAIAILILYIVHYATMAVNHLMGKGESKQYINRRVYLFGIAALLSMTYLQTSIFSTILTWLTLIPLLLLHTTTISVSGKINQIKDHLWMGYYFLQFVWFFGIIVDFYSL